MYLRKLIPAVLLSVGLVTAGLPAQQQTVDAEIVIARSVDDREPVGAGEDFPSNVGQLAGRESLVPRTRPLNMSGATRGKRTSFR